MTVSTRFGRLWKAVRLLLLVATTMPVVWLSGCEVGYGNFRLKLAPPQAAPPTPGVKIGQVTIEGRIFCLYDHSDDGVPDFVYDPDTGRWYRIENPPQVIPPPHGPSGYSVQTVGIGDLATPIDQGDAYDTIFLEIGQWSWVADAVDLDSGIAGSAPFNFAGMNAEQWIELVGLDVEPETVVDIDQVTALHFLDTETKYTDLQVPISSAFHMPDVLQYDVDYEIYGVPSEVGGPTFHVIRIAGDATEIIGYLVEMGVMEMSGEHDGSTWSVIADEDAQTADVFQDGALVASIPFQ